MNPSVESLRREFGGAIGRARVSCGDTIVYVQRERLIDVMSWLKNTPGEAYDYLVDVTAVEYRDLELPIEVVYELRSLERHADLRVKVELPKDEPLEVDSVTSLWRA
ncbi:MAG: NADH-quinone oxidoreductase subunit C, partial [Gemmatimonadales bacterium]